MGIRSVVVLVTAAFVGSAIAADCDPATSAAAFGSLAVLLSNPDLDACATASAYDMMHATGMPSSAQNKKMCAAPECHRFIKAVGDLNPPNCDLLIPTSGAKLNIKALVDAFEPGCKSTTPAPTTDKPTTAPAPSATTDKPTAAPTPSPSTDKPTSAPTPSASSDKPTTAPTKGPYPVPAPTTTKPDYC
uniref:Elicitin n=1 Tax=Lagenidium giganteum TaxID=4803 RepID=W0G5D7_9STRA|nr:elicitin [Lagenidium giganteum]